MRLRRPEPRTADPAGAPRPHGSLARRRARQRGQIVVIFAGAVFALVALCATVVDVAWYWTNNLKMQRAADAAALAGVVWLPGNVNNAYSVARTEASKNGYTDGVDGIAVTPLQDPASPRRLKVTISGPVGTFFARVVGINSWPAQREAKADYVLPVPMGSPNNYYGVGYFVEPQTLTNHQTRSGDSGDQSPGGSVLPANWTPSSNFGGDPLAIVVRSNDNAYAYTTSDKTAQDWGQFGLLNNLASGDSVINVTGIRVILTDVRLSSYCFSSTNRVVVQLSWDGGVNWTTATSNTQTPSFNSTTSNTYTLGSTYSTSAWTAPGLNWDTNSDTKLSDDKFMVRLTAAKGCGNGSTQIRVDQVRVRVDYDYDHVTTSTVLNPAPVPAPAGQPAIAHPQNFWGAMQSKGAPNIQGDIYMTHYDVRTSSTNPNYDPNDYYKYEVEIPAGGGGSVWVFDPGFCDSSSQAGTGEYYTTDRYNQIGSTSVNPVSSYFTLTNLGTDLLNPGDDTPVADTGTTYQDMDYQDKAARSAAGESNDGSIADCGSVPWHNSWWLLASGLPKGTYAIHTYSTDPGDPNNQNQQTGLNAFAFYASAASGTPRIFGVGAMEAYVRLPGGQSTEFYFAQIDKVHAGKTMEINLWDPGDTGNLSASLQILEPTGSGYTPAHFDYSASRVSTDSGASNCDGRSGHNVTAVTTNPGGGYSNSYYNGCWLTIEVQLPNDYSAPQDPVSGEDGWWKIRYNMGGSTSDYSTDLTTWKVDIRGNPVHLVLP